MLFQARIKELESAVANLTAEREAMSAQLAEAIAANAEFETRHAADTEAVSALTAERDALALERDAAVEAKTSAEASIDSEVTRRLAAAGTDPVKRDPAATQRDEMTLAEFRQLSAFAQRNFCLKGGKLID